MHCLPLDLFVYVLIYVLNGTLYSYLLQTGRLDAATTRPDSAGTQQTNRHHQITHRKFRWVMRTIQIFFGVFAFSFHASQLTEKTVVYANGLYGVVAASAALSLLAPLLAAFLAAIYLVNWFRKWSSRRVMIIETMADLTAFILFTAMTGLLISGIGYGYAKGNQCPPGKSAECDKYNWSIAWTFAEAFAWFLASFADCASWYNVWSGPRSRGTDDETLMSMRRLRSAGNN